MKQNKKSLFVKDGINYFGPFVAITTLFFLWGIAHGMLDTLDKNFQDLLHLKKWQSSFIQFSLYGAYFGMAIPAGLFIKKHGYKKGIIFGLMLFACGALLAAGTAPFESFILFLICLLIIGAGLTTLETAANPYTTKLGPPEGAERRINFSQSFNGLAWVIGPLIALYVYGNQSHVEGEKMTSIILPFAIIGLVVLGVAVIFMRLRLPEITEEDETVAHGGGVSATDRTPVSDPNDPAYISKKPLWQNRHFKLGFIAQACYVAAQTGVFSFLINFVTDHDMHPRFDVQDAPYFLSLGFLLFMIGRITGSAMMKHFRPTAMLALYSLAICLLLPVVAVEFGWVSLIAIYAVFFFMSIMFPTIFALAIKSLGSQTKKGAAFLVMAVAGGAVFPPIMGAVGDAFGMSIGFLAPIPLFAFILYYAVKGHQIESGFRQTVGRSPDEILIKVQQMRSEYVIGVDFGTDSVRGIVADAMHGTVIASSVSPFTRWAKGLYCNAAANEFRQHPLDYIEGLESVMTQILETAGAGVRESVRGISIATTGSTPVAVDAQGSPLALSAQFEENPNAMFILWKDHSAIREAEEINRVSQNFPVDYMKYVGGSYSSEWFWAKLLHILRVDREVQNACFSWVEHSDWMPFLLTGGTDARRICRNVCAAGHKGLWANEFDGLPPITFFEAVDPLLVPHAGRFGNKVYHAAQPAGNLSPTWADRLGLTTNVVVGIGAIDAHVGAVGGNIKPYYMSKVIGTSTCDMMVVPVDDIKGIYIKGISGQVQDSIIPGMVGLEAGQSAFGDIYSWFRDLLLWPLHALDQQHGREDVLYTKLGAGILAELDKMAMGLPVEEGDEFALDWFNGRRSPAVNPNLKGLIGGLTLGSTAPKIYRALVEATCFGSRAIVECLEDQGIHIEGIQAVGGIAVKSDFVVQMLANVLARTVQVGLSEQTVALGTAIFAAVVCGIYPKVQDAAAIMAAGEGRTVFPDLTTRHYFDDRYRRYKRYGDFEAATRFLAMHD